MYMTYAPKENIQEIVYIISLFPALVKKRGKKMKIIDDVLNRMVKMGKAKTVLVLDSETKKPIGTMPMLEIDSDYQWQMKCLESRKKHPEWYKDENVEEEIKKLEKWLAEHKPIPRECYVFDPCKQQQVLLCEMDGSGAVV